MRKLCVAISAVALLATPAVALGQSLPPGNSGVDQYTENLPGPGGDKPTDGGNGGGGGGGDQGSGGGGGEAGNGELSATEAQALSDQGPNGAAAAQLAEQTAPAKAKHATRVEHPSGSDDEGGGFSIGDTVSALTGSDSAGMGIFLPILLGATLLGAIALGAARMLRRGEPDEV
jgi:hypothetical protein